MKRWLLMLILSAAALASSAQDPAPPADPAPAPPPVEAVPPVDPAAVPAPPADPAPAPPPVEAAPQVDPAAAPAPPPVEAAPPVDPAAVPLPAELPPPAAPAPAPPPAVVSPAPPPPADVRQVQIQVWISETGEEGLRDLGANLQYSRFVKGEELSGSLQQVSTNVYDLSNSSYAVTMPAPDQTLFSPPLRPDSAGSLSDGLQTQQGVGLTFTLVDGDYGTINGAFRALEERSDIDLISKPELLVINGRSAKIQAGGEVPYQSLTYTNTGATQLDVSWQEIGVTLDMTPTILSDDMVQVNLTQLAVNDTSRIDSVRGIDLPVFSTRSQSGAVLVPNGQTLVIGGLSSRVTRRSERRVPLVGALPAVGVPFRGRQSEADTSHLLIFVSPTIVDLANMTPMAVDALEFWRKEMWRHADEIDQEAKQLQDEM